MARGVNRVTLVGNLGSDPDIKYSQTGAAIANISVATSSAYKDKKTDKWVETTEWHRVVFFNRLAEVVRDFLHKGSKVYIEGSLRTRKWQDKQKVDHYTTEVMGHEMQMLDGKRADADRHQDNSNTDGQEVNPYKPAEQGGEQYQDDIPF